MLLAVCVSFAALCTFSWGIAMLELGRSDDLLPPDHECYLTELEWRCCVSNYSGIKTCETCLATQTHHCSDVHARLGYTCVKLLPKTEQLHEPRAVSATPSREAMVSFCMGTHWQLCTDMNKANPKDDIQCFSKSEHWLLMGEPASCYVQTTVYLNTDCQRQLLVTVVRGTGKMDLSTFIQNTGETHRRYGSYIAYSTTYRQTWWLQCLRILPQRFHTGPPLESPA